MNLTISNLTKTYSNGVRALNNISLTIPSGMFGLLGPNGAGKSSLMRTIATLQDPDGGTIFLDDLDVLKNKDEVRKVLGYLPQEFGVYPKVSAEEMLSHIAVLKGITQNKQRKETVEALLNQTNLYDARKRKLGTYSGGMKQRFGIAQALLGNPKMVIVDEPTAGLDPAERNRFLNLLSEIGENIVVILSTHIVEDVSDLCRNMAIIYKGNLLLIDDPLHAIEVINGTIWQKAIEKHELASYQEKYNVIFSRLYAGKTIIHVASTNRPGEGFEQVMPDLRDVYFTSIQNHLKK
ncbi:MAG: ABC transporter ATP-binding protein [Bacteroidia bacterium]